MYVIAALAENHLCTLKGTVSHDIRPLFLQQIVPLEPSIVFLDGFYKNLQSYTITNLITQCEIQQGIFSAFCDTTGNIFCILGYNKEYFSTFWNTTRKIFLHSGIQQGIFSSFWDTTGNIFCILEYNRKYFLHSGINREYFLHSGIQQGIFSAFWDTTGNRFPMYPKTQNILCILRSNFTLFYHKMYQLRNWSALKDTKLNISPAPCCIP